MLKVINTEIMGNRNLNMVWCNNPVSIHVDNSMVDYKLYQKDPTDIRKGQGDSIEVLDLLAKLGYPMDLVGTYLYKDMILIAKNYLLDIQDDQVQKNQLLAQMQSPYSQFYFDIARNDLDIGIKTFHEYVNEAIENIQYNKADSILMQEIYPIKANEIPVGKNAFLLSQYLVNKQKTEKQKQYQKQKISECV